MLSDPQFETSEVVHNKAQSRFEIPVGNVLCVLDYRQTPDKLIIYHTEVPQPFERHGLAARMTHAALDFARAQNLKVEPRCPYTAAFMKKHPKYADLLLAL